MSKLGRSLGVIGIVMLLIAMGITVWHMLTIAFVYGGIVGLIAAFGLGGSGLIIVGWWIDPKGTGTLRPRELD